MERVSHERSLGGTPQSSLMTHSDFVAGSGARVLSQEVRVLQRFPKVIGAHHLRNHSGPLKKFLTILSSVTSHILLKCPMTGTPLLSLVSQQLMLSYGHGNFCLLPFFCLYLPPKAAGVVTIVHCAPAAGTRGHEHPGQMANS